MECDKDIANQPAMRHTLDRILKSDSTSFFNHTNISERRNMVFFLNILIRIVPAIITSGIVYVLLVYSFGYGLATAGYVTAGVMVFLLVGLVFSRLIRCIVLIMIPNMFTNRGRGIILSIITGLLLSGPAMNIAHNTEEVSQSLGCTADLIYNQTSLLRGQLEEPIRNLRQKLFDYMRNLQVKTQAIQSSMKPITDSLRSFSMAVRSSVERLQILAKQCETGIRQAENECTKNVNRARGSCKNTIDRIDPTVTITDAISDIFGGLGKRKRRGTNNTLAEHGLPRSLVKRGVLSSICNILDVSRGVCGALGSVSAICSPVQFLSNTMMRAAKSTLDVINEVKEFFDFRIVNDVDLTGSSSASKNASTVVYEIREDILEKTEKIRYIFSFINRILSTSLFFLFFTSFSYVLKYRRKLSYDNRYITTDFIHFDNHCKRQGKESVLPLRKNETKKYMFTTSKCLAMTELSYLRQSSFLFGYHLIISILFIAFDYILYYAMMLIHQYAGVALTVEGVSTIDVDIDGRGVFSIILRALVSTIDLNSTYSVDFNFTTCLPTPTSPDVFNNSLIICLYVLALVMLVMQAYGSRLRRKIASSYYPEQEKDRLLYLHEKIICDRIAFKAMLKDQVYRRRKENAVRDHFAIRGCFADKLSYLYGWCDVILPEKRSCHACDLPARRGRTFVKCQNTLCNATFCKECFSIMDGICFVCDINFEKATE